MKRCWLCGKKVGKKAHVLHGWAQGTYCEMTMRVYECGTCYKRRGEGATRIRETVTEQVHRFDEGMGWCLAFLAPRRRRKSC